MVADPGGGGGGLGGGRGPRRPRGCGHSVVAAGASDCVLLGLFLAGRRASTPWSRRGVAALGRLARVGWRAGSRRPTLRPAAGRACPPPPPHRQRPTLQPAAGRACPPPPPHRRRGGAVAESTQNGRVDSGHWHRRQSLRLGGLGGGAPGAEGVGGRGRRPGGGCVPQFPMEADGHAIGGLCAEGVQVTYAC